MPELDPSLPYVSPSFDSAVAEIDEALDVDLAASGVIGERRDVHREPGACVEGGCFVQRLLALAPRSAM